MHFKDAKAHGESDERLNLVCVWREVPHFSDRERAALLWTETLTRIADQGVPDDVFDEVRQHFSEEELVNLTLAVVTINAWNRIAISFRPEVGPYQPPAQCEAEGNSKTDGVSYGFKNAQPSKNSSSRNVASGRKPAASTCSSIHDFVSG